MTNHWHIYMGDIEGHIFQNQKYQNAGPAIKDFLDFSFSIFSGRIKAERLETEAKLYEISKTINEEAGGIVIEGAGLRIVWSLCLDACKRPLLN